MKRTKLDIIREAIEVQGYLPVPGPRGQTYRIRAITGVASNGAWTTDHLTADLCGYLRIKRSAQNWMVEIAQDILARREVIVAERERNYRVAMGRD